MTRQRVKAEPRRRVFERARHYCEYCRSPERYSPDPFAVEHIVPVIKGGTTTLSNLALSCQGCNSHKYDKTEGRDPVSKKVAPLYHPRRQRWSDHFTWNEDCTLVIGLTPTGRATVAEMDLNREGLINLRDLLILVKRHPPEEIAPEED